MKAGRKLDAMIAEHVMGLVPRRVRVSGSTDEVTIYTDSPYYSGPTVERRDVWHVEPKPYSKEMTYGWQVVEKMRRTHWTEVSGIGRPVAVWRATFQKMDDEDGDLSVHRPIVKIASTAPLAICLAALDAVGAEVPA